MIDMSTVAPPDVVQPLDFEALFSELKAEILARLPELAGALLLLAADLCAQRLFMPYQLPVGVVTVSLGGIYLIVLLVQESRRK